MYKRVQLAEYANKFTLYNRVRVSKEALSESVGYASLLVDSAKKKIRQNFGYALIDGHHIKEVPCTDPESIEFSADMVIFTMEEFNNFMIAIFGNDWRGASLTVLEEVVCEHI